MDKISTATAKSELDLRRMTGRMRLIIYREAKKQCEYHSNRMNALLKRMNQLEDEMRTLRLEYEYHENDSNSNNAIMASIEYVNPGIANAK